eukprot:7260062-Pyramimonas_sp.AAC.1
MDVFLAPGGFARPQDRQRATRAETPVHGKGPGPLGSHAASKQHDGGCLGSPDTGRRERHKHKPP